MLLYVLQVKMWFLVQIKADEFPLQQTAIVSSFSCKFLLKTRINNCFSLDKWRFGELLKCNKKDLMCLKEVWPSGCIRGRSISCRWWSNINAVKVLSRDLIFIYRTIFPPCSISVAFSLTVTTSIHFWQMSNEQSNCTITKSQPRLLNLQTRQIQEFNHVTTDVFSFTILSLLHSFRKNTTCKWLIRLRDVWSFMFEQELLRCIYLPNYGGKMKAAEIKSFAFKEIKGSRSLVCWFGSNNVKHSSNKAFYPFFQ